MKAVIIENEDYNALPFILCDAIWEISHRHYGFKMISRETKREIDKDIMVGMLLAFIKKILEAVGDGNGKEIARDANQEVKKEMMNKWIELKVSKDETLRCDSCQADLHNQKLHLYIDVNDSIDEIMCDTCWKKEEAKG